MLDNELENVQKTTFDQDEINKQLQDICIQLKSIPNIGVNYLEYISALIYVLYENRIDFEHILTQNNNIKFILDFIENSLEKIRENENRLFINIRFKDNIREENYDAFKQIILNLFDLILDLEKYDNSKHILAKSYEYIILKAVQAGYTSLNNEEYYTPKGVVKTMVKLANIQDKAAIYNPASGSGNFFVESARTAQIFAFGEEPNISNFNICNTNLWLHDIKDKRINSEYGEYGEGSKMFDVAIGNPPFSSDTLEISALPPTSSSYTKFLVMMFNSINENGKVEIILPHGFLFKKSRAEYYLRKELVNNRYIDAIIGLPDKLFYDTKIPVIILSINKAKRNNEILFIDASKEYTSKRRTNILAINNQDKIVNTYNNRTEIDGFSRLVNIEEIVGNDFDLSIKRYITANNEVKSIDVDEIENKIRNLDLERKEIQEQIANIIHKNKPNTYWSTNMCLVFLWCNWRDSNPRPSGS